MSKSEIERISKILEKYECKNTASASIEILVIILEMMEKIVSGRGGKA